MPDICPLLYLQATTYTQHLSLCVLLLLYYCILQVCTGSCDCPTGDICDINCANEQCSNAQFTGVFRNMFCGKGACNKMELVVKVKRAG